ncbi:MAG TPA: A/G-specific adenine glycosylase [Gemmataceae bacterium]|nr:A/G-specific adenine glycosylase [Gemmataceae bacterium]
MSCRNPTTYNTNPTHTEGAVAADEGEIVASLRRRLRRWYARHRRDLPWRHDRDPYRIWVSEVMLQQTQVATVIPYFQRFLQAFPTLADLAAADEQDVLRLWEGLGYYRRARDLHRAAQQVMAEHNGRFPRDPAQLARLPGMGRYTVAAVLSQAFDRRLPIVEANTQRVLCRLFGRRDDPRRGPARRWLWQIAEALLPPRRGAGEFNQALMELGALVCTPQSPRCSACPLKDHCAARRLGLQDQIPARPAPPEVIEVQEAAAVVRRGGRVLLVRRPANGRWVGLWEFPHGPLRDDETHEEAAVRLLRELTDIRAEVGPELATIRHGITRYRITLVCFEARYRAGDFCSAFYVEGRWVRPEELAVYPVSVPQRRLTRALLAPDRQRRLF